MSSAHNFIVIAQAKNSTSWFSFLLLIKHVLILEQELNAMDESISARTKQRARLQCITMVSFWTLFCLFSVTILKQYQSPWFESDFLGNIIWANGAM